MGKVLLVDDDLTSLTMARRALELAGHEVVSTTDPTEALQLGRELHVEVVVLDVSMPELSGFDVLEELRRTPRLQALPVLFLSGFSSARDRVVGLKKGADDYLTKPFEPDELTVRIENLLMHAMGGIRGDLETMTLGEVVQALIQSGKHGTLRVEGMNGDGGLVRIQNGHLMGGEYGALRDGEAFVALCGIQRGRFVFTPSEECLEQTGTPLSGLLLEAMWLEDEVCRRKDLLRDLERPLLRTKEKADLADEYASLPTERVLEMLGEKGSVALSELLARDIAAPRRVELCAALLLEMGAISFQGEGRSFPEQEVGTKETHQGVSGSAEEAAEILSQSEHVLRRFIAFAEASGKAETRVELRLIASHATAPKMLSLLAGISDELLEPDSRGKQRTHAGGFPLVLDLKGLKPVRIMMDALAHASNGADWRTCAATILWLDTASMLHGLKLLRSMTPAPTSVIFLAGVLGGPATLRQTKFVYRTPQSFAELLDPLWERRQARETPVLARVAPF